MAKFGIELETTVPSGQRHIIGGYHRGRNVEGTLLTWNAQYDSSIVVTQPNRLCCEFVMTTPAEMTADNLVKLKHDIEFFERTFSAKINKSCGVHIHIEWTSDSLKDLRKLTHIVSHYEEAIFGATGTTNREQGHWCKSLKSRYERLIPRTTRREGRNAMRFLNRRIHDRYLMLNLQPLVSGRRGAVEFRAFSGSVNPTKIISWLCLCAGIVENAQSKTTCPKWNAPVASVEQSYRANGRAETAMERLFYRLGWWPKKKCLGTKEIRDASEDLGLPTLKQIKDELLRLVRKYDAMKGTNFAQLTPEQSAENDATFAAFQAIGNGRSFDSVTQL